MCGIFTGFLSNFVPNLRRTDMNRLYSVWNIIRRFKYVVVLAFIVLIDGFVDENSYWNTRLRRQRIVALRHEIAQLKQKYEEDTRRYEALGEHHELERVAREKYHMKRADEDVFVIYSPEQSLQPQTDSTALVQIERQP